MSNSIGKIFRLTIFGASHGPAIGVTIEGVPAGISIDMESLRAFMDRRRPGRDRYSTPRQEADTPEFIAGLKDNVTIGAPIAAIIKNADAHSQDYEDIRFVPRPGHADFTSWVKYGESRDYRGGGQFSGRMTAPLCIAGAIAMQILSGKNISISSRIKEIGGKTDEAEMMAAIDRAREEGDSVGGMIECVISGVPAGIGEPMFDGIENRIAQTVFGIPAVKGIEFGAGFRAARMRGSEHNDAFYFDKDLVRTRTNNAGGILGGITDGEDIVFFVAFKPTPSIGLEQSSVNLKTRENVSISVGGRHDPCIVPRALPVVEAAAACAIYDEILLGLREEK